MKIHILLISLSLLCYEANSVATLYIKNSNWICGHGPDELWTLCVFCKQWFPLRSWECLSCSSVTRSMTLCLL